MRARLWLNDSWEPSGDSRTTLSVIESATTTTTTASLLIHIQHGLTSPMIVFAENYFSTEFPIADPEFAVEKEKKNSPTAIIVSFETKRLTFGSDLALFDLLQPLGAHLGARADPRPGLHAHQLHQAGPLLLHHCNHRQQLV